jgi:hypothetical protein
MLYARFRKARIAMGIAIFSLLAVAGEVSAQPRRDRRLA